MKILAKQIGVMIGLFVLVMTAMALAQTVPADVNNPTSFQWDCSVDHSQVTSYELDVLRPDLTVLQTLNLGKPVPSPLNVCTAPLNVQPIVIGNGYSARIRAVAPGGNSVYTPSLNKFNRILAAVANAFFK